MTVWAPLDLYLTLRLPADRELTVDSVLCPSEMRKAKLLVISRLWGLPVNETVPW